ncbi:MAG: hypothetical protein IPM24_19680 [Bryobacterales bacterium]|nr:hypothetical protein [Bryobacterales bacterium]
MIAPEFLPGLVDLRLGDGALHARDALGQPQLAGIAGDEDLLVSGLRLEILEQAIEGLEFGGVFDAGEDEVPGKQSGDGGIARRRGLAFGVRGPWNAEHYDDWRRFVFRLPLGESFSCGMALGCKWTGAAPGDALAWPASVASPGSLS